MNKQALKIIAGWFLLCFVPVVGPTLSSIWFVTCLVLVLKGVK